MRHIQVFVATVCCFNLSEKANSIRKSTLISFCIELSVSSPLSHLCTVKNHSKIWAELHLLIFSESWQHSTVYGPWSSARRLLPATHGLQSPCGPVITKRRSSGGAQWSGKAFKTPFGQVWPTALRVNRLLKTLQLLKERARTSHVHSCVYLWHFLGEKVVFVGTGGGSGPASCSRGKCMRWSSHGKRYLPHCFRRKKHNSSPVWGHSRAPPLEDQAKWGTLCCAIPGQKHVMSAGCRHNTRFVISLSSCPMWDRWAEVKQLKTCCGRCGKA